MSEILDVIKLYLKENRDVSLFITGIVFFALIGTSLLFINVMTVEQSEVSAPCELIKSSTPLPDNVITKGYDIIRGNDTIEYTNGQTVTNPTIDYECYYIKDAGAIERLIYQWDLYN